MRLDGCHALITGASAGIGREFARQLAGRAATLALVARREQRLEQLRDELLEGRPPRRSGGDSARPSNSLRVEIRPLDLSKHESIDELLLWIEQEKLAIDLLINNAGLGDFGSFATSDAQRTDQIMQVNIAALTHLTRALLPSMMARRRGAILNVSSSAGFLPIPNFSVYAASKAYVTSFSEALRAELRGTGVQVNALCPGPVRTEFSDVARREARQPAPREPSIAYVSVEEVVATALRGLESNRAIIIPGWVMKIGMTLVRLTPMPLLRLANRFTKKPD